MIMKITKMILRLTPGEAPATAPEAARPTVGHAHDFFVSLLYICDERSIEPPHITATVWAMIRGTIARHLKATRQPRWQPRWKSHEYSVTSLRPRHDRPSTRIAGAAASLPGGARARGGGGSVRRIRRFHARVHRPQVWTLPPRRLAA